MFSSLPSWLLKCHISGEGENNIVFTYIKADFNSIIF